MPYSCDDIDLMISRAHRDAENQEDLEKHQRKIIKAPDQFFCKLPTGESQKRLGTRS